MSESDQTHAIPRQQLIAIRQARRYLKSNAGILARILNAYKDADAAGVRRGYLAER